MSTTDVIHKIEQLPTDLLPSASDYIDFLLEKAKTMAAKETSGKRILGKAKGMVTWIAPDFDAPLDDLKDYM